MASAEMLKIAHSVDTKVTGVDDRVKGVEGKVQDVRNDVQDVGNEVRAVDDRVQDIGRDVRGEVQDVGTKVQDVEDKLDQVNRSLILQRFLIVPRTQIASQGISSEIVFSDGYRPQIHLSTITLHARLIIMIQPNGSFKAVYSISGNLPTLSCGYTENVGCSLPLPSVNS